MIAVDTETTGFDLYHGARPYCVTTCDGEEIRFWEWDVDPLTREVVVDPQDISEIESLLSSHDLIVGQNIKFDVGMLQGVGVLPSWPWDRTRDTLLAGHLLASNQPHDLTSMAMDYLGLDIEHFEERLKEITMSCRRRVQQARLARNRGKPKARHEDALADWMIAEEGLPCMPSAGKEPWKADAWICRAMAKHDEADADDPRWTVLAEYANADSQTTFSLYQRQDIDIQSRGLEAIYLERMRLPEIALALEQRGITYNRKWQSESKAEYMRESESLAQQMRHIAILQGYPCLELPSGGMNASLKSFLFDVLKLPPLKYSDKTGEPSTDKASMEYWSLYLPENSQASVFIKSLLQKRKRDTAISYLNGYEKFGLPISGPKYRGWYLLHPILNPTGTATLRWSSNNPNEQNISKQEGFNLRRVFGPLPGREWWSLDYQNLELRIPAFEAGEKELIDVFLRPNDPPYYGSYHLAIFDLLHPKLFAEHGKKCKDLFESTWYQYVKNGNFAVLYGAQEEKADATYHVQGAYEKIRHRFPRMAALSDKMLQLATREGRVYTIPDTSIDPKHGYPIMTTRTEFGDVMPTVPLNYHIQSTAMQCTARAMVRTFDFLRSRNRDEHLAMQVHDEIVFDTPAGNGEQPWKTNLPVVRELQRLMEKSGEGIGVPTPVAIEYHSTNWAEGERINAEATERQDRNPPGREASTRGRVVGGPASWKASRRARLAADSTQ